MDVVKTLQPGKNGTKRFVERYGNDLVAVRYRRDAESHISFTTVELIVERKEKPRKTFTDTITQRQYNQQTVAVRVFFREEELRLMVKQAGGIWHPKKKAWLIPYEDAIKLGLQERIIPI
ncbi:hypothetical protein [Pseudomonas paeninsulae]|uniref:hypothetical protein n=1 Tax=Pseudomonas paeninsulae TaxID=3110772 RepID=UPI002D76A89E|nr:hypothetical protein [Pseudomonas sp. IT1137]